MPSQFSNPCVVHVMSRLYLPPYNAWNPIATVNTAEFSTRETRFSLGYALTVDIYTLSSLTTY